MIVPFSIDVLSAALSAAVAPFFIFYVYLSDVDNFHRYAFDFEIASSVIVVGCRLQAGEVSAGCEE